MNEVTAEEVFVQAIHRAARQNEHYSISHVSREAFEGKPAYMRYITECLEILGSTSDVVETLVEELARSFNDSLNGEIPINCLSAAERELISRSLFPQRSFAEEQEFIEVLQGIHFSADRQSGAESGVAAEKLWHLRNTMPKILELIPQARMVLKVFSPVAIRQVNNYLEGENSSVGEICSDLLMLFLAQEYRWRQKYAKSHSAYISAKSDILRMASMFHPASQ